MKLIKTLLLALLCMLSMHSSAQVDTPQYKSLYSPLGGNYVFFPSSEEIFYPKDLPNMPSGFITNVYYCIGRITSQAHSSKKYNLIVRMKNTAKMFYPNQKTTPRIPDTPIIQRNEAILARYPVFSVPDLLHEGTWIKIPLNLGKFYYSGTQNFALNITYDSVSGVDYPVIVAQSVDPYRFLGFLRNNDSLGLGTSASGWIYYGFDIATTGVPGIKNLQSVGLFPNPSTGRFQLSFESAKAVKVVQVSVADASGRQVYAHGYNNVGTSFFKEVNLEGIAKGIYFLKLEADGEVIKRQVVLE